MTACDKCGQEIAVNEMDVCAHCERLMQAFYYRLRTGKWPQ